MSFKNLLHIDENLLEHEDRKAFEFCEEKWNRAGHPTKKRDVIPFIESLLKEFIASDLSYPRVLLLRKKELQRGTFTLDTVHVMPIREIPRVVDVDGRRAELQRQAEMIREKYPKPGNTADNPSELRPVEAPA